MAWQKTEKRTTVDRLTDCFNATSVWLIMAGYVDIKCYTNLPT